MDTPERPGLSDILGALLSGKVDVIRQILASFPFGLELRFSPGSYASQALPTLKEHSNFTAGTDKQGVIHFMYIEVGDRENMMDSPQVFRAGFVKRRLLPCPNDISKADPIDIQPMCVRFPPGEGYPFLILTEVLDISTFCFIVDVRQTLYMANFIPCDDKLDKWVQKSDEMTDYLMHRAVSGPKVAGKVCVWGPRNFRRSPMSKVGKAAKKYLPGNVMPEEKWGAMREHDKCFIMTLWVPDSGWHVYAQVLRPRRGGGPHDLVVAKVVQLYVPGMEGPPTLIWKYKN